MIWASRVVAVAWASMCTLVGCGASENSAPSPPAEPRIPLIAASEIKNHPVADPGWRRGELRVTLARDAEGTEVIEAVLKGRAKAWCESGRLKFHGTSDFPLKRRHATGDVVAFSVDCQRRLPGQMDVPDGASSEDQLMNALDAARNGGEDEWMTFVPNQPIGPDEDPYEIVERFVGRSVIEHSMAVCGERGVVARQLLTALTYEFPATAEQAAEGGQLTVGLVLDCAGQAASQRPLRAEPAPSTAP